VTIVTINYEFIDPEYSDIGHPEAEGSRVVSCSSQKTDKINEECLKYIAGYVALDLRTNTNWDIL
jgi:hypothetical protein